MMFGPGAACAIANRSANCRSVIQPETSTAWRCISGTTAIAPPIANSEMQREMRRERAERVELHRRIQAESAIETGASTSST